MRRFVIIGAALFALIGPARAADSSVPGMLAGSAVSDTDLLYCGQSAGTLDRKCTSLQLANYLFGKVSGDLTCAAGGACTLKATGPGATGPIGSTTTTPSVTIDAQGRVTGISSNPIAFPVTSITGDLGVTVNPTTGAVVVSGGITDSAVATTTYTLASGDGGVVKRFTNAAAVAVTVPAPTGFASNWFTTLKSDAANAGGTTFTPSGTTIDGSSSPITLAANQSLDLYVNSSGTGYTTLPGRSTGGGGTTTIASGAAALGTTAISSGACAAAVSATATGVATTDTLTASFNGDPTAVTGYIPATAGMLTIFAYPTANTVNFKVCNNTSAPITPGPITLNWRVVR